MFSLLLTITTTQAIGSTLSNGCPSDMPNRYPGNNRCFQHVWYGSMCNVDPRNDPLSWQQSDTPCLYEDRIFKKKLLSNIPSSFTDYLQNTICPKSASQMVDCYRCDSGEGKCTEFMVFKDEAQLNRYMNYHTWMTPDMWKEWVDSESKVHAMQNVGGYDDLHNQMEDTYSNCVRVLPSHGQELPNGCPVRVSNRYPGNNRCFESVWDGEMCNVNPEQDPLVWQQNDRQCAFELPEEPPAGHFYAYDSPNDCSGSPIGKVEWDGKLDMCEPIDIHKKSMGGSDLFPSEHTKYFKMWCDADVLKTAVYSDSCCSGAPVRDPSVIPRSASGDCHVRTNWKNGLVQSHIITKYTALNGDWFSELGGGFMFRSGEYPCPNRRNLKETASTVRRMLNSMQ